MTKKEDDGYSWFRATQCENEEDAVIPGEVNRERLQKWVGK